MDYKVKARLINTITAFILAMLCALHCSSQNVDIFEGKASLFHADAKRSFESRDDELAKRVELMNDVKAFEKDNNWHSQNLLSRLQNYEKLTKALKRHELYYELLELRGTNDTAAISAENGMENIEELLNSKIDSILQSQAIAALSLSDIKKLGLENYLFLQTVFFVNRHGLTYFRPVASCICAG